MEDLKDACKAHATGMDFIQNCWATSEKNLAARYLITGMADGMRYAGVITLEQYDAVYKLAGM